MNRQERNQNQKNTKRRRFLNNVRRIVFGKVYTYRKIYTIGTRVLDKEFFEKMELDIKEYEHRKANGEDMSYEAHKEWFMNL